MKIFKIVFILLLLNGCARERLLTKEEIVDSCLSAERSYQSARDSYYKMSERVSSNFNSTYGSTVTPENMVAIDQAARSIAYSEEAQVKKKAQGNYEWWCLEATPGSKVLDDGNTLQFIEKAPGKPQKE